MEKEKGKDMQEKISEVCATVLDRITPKKSERAKIETIAKKLVDKVVLASKTFAVNADVRLEGSAAKDTWLSEDPEIDIFMRVPTTIPRKSLGKVCLKVAREATAGTKQVERFAEHPYLEAFVDGVRVNIVPCYKVKRGEWLSATDRTPFHTDYIKKRLSGKMRGEVRLLKKFMKGVEVYGAEIKVGGFSGYLCELLILYYKSFLNTLKAFANYKRKIVLDIENHYGKRAEDLELLFKEPLVVVDPIDKGRNVASAVQAQKLYIFVAAARSFLKSPSINFFYPPETRALTFEEFKQQMKKRESTILFLTFEKIDAVPDILWGQLYKSQRSLEKLLRINEFNILRILPWSDEKTVNMFIIELEQSSLPPTKKHVGPPLEKQTECEKFLKKYASNANTVSGPFIEDGRWMVEVRRKHTNAIDFLTEKLMDGGRMAGMAEQISRKLREGFKIFVNEEIVDLYKENREFAKFLTEFLSGKPKWLESA